MLFARCLFISLFLLFVCAQVFAAVRPTNENRVALVVGNANYRLDPLKNPISDAKDMTQALGQLGFDVLHFENTSLRDMQQALNRFSRKLKQENSVGFFYYAGHAIQVEDRNYLLPIDADIHSQHDIKTKALQLGNILSEMESVGNGLSIVVLDACRNNPFLNQIVSDSSGLSRSLERGISLKQKALGLAPTKSPAGMYIAYATAPNMVAADGVDQNGLYTKYLLKYIREQGLSLEQVFKKVRQDVAEESHGLQIPWERSSLVSDFYLNPTRVQSSKEQFASLLRDAERLINKGNYGVAYRKVTLAKKLAGDVEEQNHIDAVMSDLKKRLER